ncbi:hypothetical protein QEV61_05400 [Trueperella pyogenes]|uniref:hypothetical protein n=1 Tax=Trueperella pyogenes TaxID=1661 RepID=UPI003256284D
MGVPMQVVLDVPPDIYTGLASGALVRVGGVVRNAKTGAIVKHLGEGRLPAKEAANSVANVAQRVWASPAGKAGVVVVAAVGLVMSGKVVADKWANRRHDKALNAALKAYLNAAQAGEMTVEVIDNLSGAIKSANGSGSNDSVQIAEQIVSLVEEYTVALAQANETTWKPERGADVVPLARLEHSLSVQRRILETAA